MSRGEQLDYSKRHIYTLYAMAYLVLVRHGESLWNAKGIWTGLTDIPLSVKGRQEAKAAGEKITLIIFVN